MVEVGGVMKKLNWLILFGMAFLLAGCSNAITQSTTLEASATETIPTQDTVTPSMTIMFTTSPTPSPTRTPLITLSVIDADNKFIQWLSGTSDCLFPCWAGILPGTTLWEDALYKLKPVLQMDIPFTTKCRFGQCGLLYWKFSRQHDNHYDYTGSLFENGDTLYAVTIGGEYNGAIGLRKIFETYGQPSQVFVDAMSNYAGDPPLFDVIVLYKQFKFIIRYEWFAELGKDEIVACGKPKSFNLGIVAIDEDQWTPREIAENGNQRNDFDSGVFTGRLRPISEVTDMSIEDLYNQVTKSISEFCIGTPLKYWP